MKYKLRIFRSSLSMHDLLDAFQDLNLTEPVPEIVLTQPNRFKKQRNIRVSDAQKIACFKLLCTFSTLSTV